MCVCVCVCVYVCPHIHSLNSALDMEAVMLLLRTNSEEYHQPVTGVLCVCECVCLYGNPLTSELLSAMVQLDSYYVQWLADCHEHCMQVVQGLQGKSQLASSEENTALGLLRKCTKVLR